MTTPTPQTPTIDDGGPAFPFKCQGPTTAPETYYGMTLRDYFAAKAMGGILAAANVRDDLTPDIAYSTAAHEAFKYADAMLAARKGGVA